MKANQNQEVVRKCKEKLLQTKQELINRVRSNLLNFREVDKASGDEIDQSVAHLEEHNFLIGQERLKTQIIEVEMALSRIELGTFGYCEETDEAIESERLLAIPWTRLSIEGAELRESMSRKYAR